MQAQNKNYIGKVAKAMVTFIKLHRFGCKGRPWVYRPMDRAAVSDAANVGSIPAEPITVM